MSQGSAPPQDAGHQLNTGVLGVWDAVAMAIATLSPAMAMAFNTSYSAAEAGVATTLAYAMAGLGCLCLAYVVVSFSRRMSHAGYVYAYVTSGFGPGAGFMSGWIYSLSFTLFVPMTMAGVGLWTSQLLGNYGLDVNWFLIFVVGLGLLFLASYFDIRLSTRSQLLFAFLSMAVILVLAVVIVGRGGASGNSVAPFSLGSSLKGVGGVFYGLIFAMLSFIGFETAAVLGEETAEPKKNIPRSVYAAVVVGVLFYLVTTYSIAIGFGPANGAKWAADATPLSTLALHYVGAWLNLLISIAAILSALVVSLACHNATTRVLFAMGRDGALPRALGRSHPVHRTPHVAIVVDLVVALFLGAAIGFPAGPETVYGFLAGTGAVGVLVIYLILSLAAVKWFRRVVPRGEYSFLKHVTVPLIGFAVFALALYGSVWPVPQFPYNLMPYIIVVWSLVGVGVLARLRSKDPGLVSRLGRLMGEDSESAESAQAT